MLALAPTAYTHFAVNAFRSSQTHSIAKSASSRMGESFWKFLPRTVIGGFKSAVKIEKERRGAQGQEFLEQGQRTVQGWAISGAVLGAAAVVGGRRSLPFLAGQAAYGASLLEVINYIEHYSLMRQKECERQIRTYPARAQLEQQPGRHQPGALPAAAPQRPPRQSHPQLPGPAERFEDAAGAGWLCLDADSGLHPRAGGTRSWTSA